MATIRLTVNTNGASLPNAYKQPKLEPVTSEDLKNPRYCSPCIHNVHNERVNSLLTYLHVLNFTGLGNNSGSDSGSNDTSRPIIRRIITGGSELYPDFIYINSTRVLNEYVATTSISVEVDLPLLSTVYDQCILRGINKISLDGASVHHEQLQQHLYDVEQRALH
uniref:Uncharacterized protein n=1 Tax=Lygus hesperus TaxID=30085 RepID=A0A0A9Z259_LYGHE